MLVTRSPKPADPSGAEVYPDTWKLIGLREKLVADLEQKGIHHPPLLQALRKVRRHAFMESAFVEKAYEDMAFPIAQGQTISQPYTVAYQTQLLALSPGEKVLEIGTGSGYQAAVLCEMGLRVYSVERDPELKTTAAERLRRMGYRLEILLGDGSQGWQRYAPYAGILVTAGSPQVPTALLAQLAIGGRLVIPVGDRRQQQMCCITRVGAQAYEEQILESFRFVPLVGQQAWQKGD